MPFPGTKSDEGFTRRVCLEFDEDKPPDYQCGRRTVALGLCNRHYKRWKRWGDPNIVLHQPYPHHVYVENGRKGGLATARYIRIGKLRAELAAREDATP